MRNILLLILAIVLVQLYAQGNDAPKKKSIYISQIVNHPALDATVNGIIDELKACGYTQENLDLKIESAQGSSLLASQIATKFVSEKPDIVIAVATGAAQSFAKYAKNGDIKLIFSSVTDPVDAGLVKATNLSDNNISGVSNMVPIEPQLELFKKIQPNLKRLGFLYNPSELNSVSLIKKLEEICPKYNIVLVKQIAVKSTDVLQSATKLSNECDAIFISNDNTALSAIAVIIQVATLHKIPVYVSDTDMVAAGAVAALGPNQYNIGRQTAEMALDILSGTDINTQNIEFPTDIDLYVNPQAALKVGITIPQEILGKATKFTFTSSR